MKKKQETENQTANSGSCGLLYGTLLVLVVTTAVILTTVGLHNAWLDAHKPPPPDITGMTRSELVTNWVGGTNWADGTNIVQVGIVWSNYYAEVTWRAADHGWSGQEVALSKERLPWSPVRVVDAPPEDYPLYYTNNGGVYYYYTNNGGKTVFYRNGHVIYEIFPSADKEVKEGKYKVVKRKKEGGFDIVMPNSVCDQISKLK